MHVKIKLLPTLFFIIIFLVLTPKSSAQANDTEAALYNIGFGAITSSIGAVINKEKNEKFDKVILKGLYQGALGGYITFESKRILRIASKKNNWKYYWGSKLINAAGTSIKENAANNNDFWEMWTLPIGFNRIEVHTRNKVSIKFRIMPISAVRTIGAFFYYKFDSKSSFLTGQFSFREFNTNTNLYAFTVPGSYIVYNDGIIPNFNLGEVRSHEIIHMYQGEDFLFVNSYYGQLKRQLFKRNNTLSKINNLLYYDLHLIVLESIYAIESKNSTNYFDNYLEQEAGYYSNTLY